MLPFLLPAIASVAAAGLNYIGQRDANKANARSVQQQIAFQEKQNATQYQRAVTDLEAAGLNPALAYKQGGADSGTGAAANFKNPLDNLTSAITLYNDLSTGTAQRQVLAEQANKTAAETTLTRILAAKETPLGMLGQDKDYIDKFIRGKRAEAANITTRIQLENAATAQATATARQQAELMRTQGILNEQDFMNDYFRTKIAPYLNSTAKAIRTVLGGRK